MKSVGAFIKLHAREIALIVFLCVSSSLIHLLAFLLHGPHPLGYDSGFYRRYILQPFHSFPNPSVPGLGDDALVPRLFLDIVGLLPISTDQILYGTYIFFWALLPVAIYFLLRPHLGMRGSFVAGLLILLSAIQYKAYWFMLWKHSFAALLFILALIAIQRRWTIPLLVLDIAIALSHKTTAILYLVTLGILFLIHTKERRWIFIHTILTATLFAVVNFDILHTVSLAAPVAIFMSWREYLFFSVPLLLILLVGRTWSLRNIPISLLAFAVASFLFPILQLPFHERIFIYGDIALVALAAFAIERILSEIDFSNPKKKTYLLGATLCVAFGFYAGFLWNEIRALQPLVSPESIEVIEKIGSSVPRDATILTTSDEAPWFQGWTSSHVAAPGMLYDSHNFEEWMALWTSTSTSEQIAFLHSLPQPLYISTLGTVEDLIGTLPSCITEIAPHLYEFRCAE